MSTIGKMNYAVVLERISAQQITKFDGFGVLLKMLRLI